ncbi:MAG: mechanosensitive ion channel family protein [Bacilli bacterium]|nr:mechanosensitive ion channel family protein [Bacilli bacterium]
MDKITGKVIDFFTSKNLIMSLIVILVGIIVYSVVASMINKASSRTTKNDSANKKRKTYLRLFNSVFKYLVIIIVCVIVLQIYGINVTSIIAGLGVVSVIAGLALQDALKDIIMGFNIIVDEYFSVGDILKIGDVEGKVVVLGFKSTKLLDINTGNTYTISNRNISDALIISKDIFIDIPLPYELKLARVEKVIGNIINQIKELEDVEDAMYLGPALFDSSAINYKIKVVAKSSIKNQTKRNALRLIKLELDKNNIDIPYTQIDIHNK